MSGMFNSYFYGKAGKADYTVENMPKNRFELFFTVLKLNLGNLVKLNLLFDLFCIPLFVWAFVNYSVLTSFEDTATAVSDFVSGGYLSAFFIGLIPCCMLIGVGSSGQMTILRNWSKDQHAFMFSDFKDALKTNWKTGLALGTINGISFPLVYICYTYYGMMASQSTFFVLPQTLMVVLFVVWWMMNMISFPMLAGYEMKFKDILRNSALMAVARLPFSVLFFIVTGLIPTALFIVPYGTLIGPIYFILIGFSVTGLIHASYANSCFDKYLNPRIDGAKVGVGMRDPALDFTSDEEEEEIRREAEKLK